MRNKGYELLRKCQFPLLAVTGIMSVMLYIYGKQGIGMVWALPGMYLAIALAVMAVPRKLRWLLAAGGAAGLVAAGLLLPGGTVSTLWGIGFALLALLSVSMAGMSWDTELPKGIYWIGLAAHALCYTLATIQRLEGKPLPQSAVTAMGICFVSFALLVLLGLNRYALTSAALGRHRAAPTVRRRNLLLVLSFFALTGLVAFTPALSAALYQGFRWLLGWLTTLASRPTDPYYEPVEDITLPEDPIIETILPADRTPVDRLDPGGVPWLNTQGTNLLFWVFMAFVLALILLALPPLIRLLSKLLKQLAQPVEEGYVDEVTYLRPEKKAKETHSAAQAREAAFGRLTPTQKIRRHYARLGKKHRWGAAKTARENLPTEQAALYEHARYSGQEATPAQAEQFLKQTK